MRLLKLNTDGSFSLAWFSKDKIPPYAILSHTWGRGEDDEVTLKDLVDGIGENKGGYQKLRFCGNQAKDDDLHYFWVDTCCIDKTDTTELTTAINSMFRWYQNAARCYVYLSDVSVRSRDEKSVHVEWESAFRNSRWFTRGWTLQELLAPKVVNFYSRDYIRLGDKHSLEQQIVGITGIAMEALRGRSLSQFGVEERFLWTEKRQTTMEEDKAYCLLGIFGVFMPLIYGEGQSSAVRRLRNEIGESIDTESQPTEPIRRGFQTAVADVTTEEAYVAVMGVTGSGKSCLIELITGRDVPVGHDLRSCTKAITSYSFMYGEKLRVHLIDTPGFDDTYRTDTDVLREIASWLAATYEKNIRLSGIIYLHRISDVRFGGSARRNLVMFQKLCGASCLPNIILATTFWDITEASIGAARERELIAREDFWGFMHSRGSAVLRHSGSRHSAMAILEWSLRSRRPLTLQIQREINIEGLSLDKTAAGRQLNEDLSRARTHHERQLIELKKEMIMALEERNIEMAKVFEDETNAWQQKLKDDELSLVRLNLDLASLLEMAEQNET